MAWYDDAGNLTVVDQRTPLDHIEPENPDAAGLRPDLTLAEIVFRVGASFREGNPEIVSAAWLYVLRGDDASMRRRAKHLGVTAAALSKRARILAESFGIRLSDPHIRDLRRRLAQAAWARRKRRADQSRPAAHAQLDEQPFKQEGHS